MNILTKSIIICFATSFVAITPLHPMGKPSSVVLNVDKDGKILSFKFLNQTQTFNVLKHESEQPKPQKPQNYQKNYIQQPQKSNSDKDHALNALKNSASYFAKGIYEFTILIFYAGKLIFVHAGDAIRKGIKKIDSMHFKTNDLHVAALADNDNVDLQEEPASGKGY